MKPTWEQPFGSKPRVGKNCTELLFSLTVNSNKYAVLTTLSSTLLGTKKENCQKTRNLGDVFHNRLRVLSRRKLGWPANWPTCQPPWWLQNTVRRYRSSLFRVQWFTVVSFRYSYFVYLIWYNTNLIWRSPKLIQPRTKLNLCHTNLIWLLVILFWHHTKRSFQGFFHHLVGGAKTLGRGRWLIWRLLISLMLDGLFCLML